MKHLYFSTTIITNTYSISILKFPANIFQPIFSIVPARAVIPAIPSVILACNYYYC